MNYPTVPIGMVFNIAGGGTPKSSVEEFWDGDIPWIGPSDMNKENGSRIARGARCITKAGFNNCGAQRVPKGSLILSIRAPIGHLKIADNSICFSQGCKGLIPREGLSQKYAYWAILSVRDELERRGQGTTFIELSRDQLRTQKIPVPNISLQEQIAAYLDRETRRIDDLIAEKGRFIDLLREKRVAKISHLVRKGDGASLKDTGIGWRGRAPASWTRSKLKALFRQEKRQGYDDLTVLSVYRDYGVIEKHSREDNINKTPENLSTYQLVEQGDLVINKMKAWQGSMGISDYRGITSPDYIVMTTKTDANPRYLHHYLRARPMPWVYRQISNGIRTDQWRLEPEKFLDLPIFLPSQKEQTKIADAIDRETTRIDGLISETEHSIALLKEKRAALITAAVTGNIDVRNAA